MDLNSSTDLLDDRARRQSRRKRETRAVVWLGPTPFQATIALLGLGLIWRTVRYALVFPLWGDEAFVAVSILSRDLAGLSKPLEFGQIAPPGFLWAEWVVTRLLGRGEWGLRLVPFLAGAAGLLLFWRFARRVASRRVVLVAVALLAASFYPARHGNEVKPYTLDLLVSLVVTALGWEVWRDPRSATRWWVLTGSAAVGVWMSYTAVFPVASVGLLLLAKVARTRSPWLMARGMAFALLSGLSWGVMAATFATTQARASDWLPDLATWKDAFPPLSEPWRIPWWLFEIHTGNMLAYPHGGNHFVSLATFLLVVVGGVAIWRRPPRRALLWLFLGPLPVALVAASLRRYPYGTSARVMLYMAPAFCLLAAEGVVALFRAWGGLRRGPVAVAGVLALLPIGFTARDVYTPYTRWDDVVCRQQVRALKERVEPGDRWVVFDGATSLPRDYPGMMLSRWVQRAAEFRVNALSLSPVPTLWEPDPSAVAVEPLSSGRTWLIVHDHGHAPVYPRARQVLLLQALTARLGPPRSEVHALPDGASLAVHLFSQPVEPGGRAKP
jgi:hypothetical protein